MKSIEQRFSTLAAAVQAAWYQGSGWLPLLYPAGWLVGGIARLRFLMFKSRAAVPSVPVLVVGNITVGGTGKTPLVAGICDYLGSRGLRVVVISRGYGARPPQYPWVVEPEQSAAEAGDEPLLIRRRTGVPVVIDPQRSRALQYVVSQYQPDVVISDDGLQHFALQRSVEIVVLDSDRGLGNGRCLPAGPLREPASRLDDVDFVVLNGRPDARWPNAQVMVLQSDDPVNLKTGERMPMEEFAARHPLVHAFAGIGNPQRFFSSLSTWDIRVTGHALPDHHAFTAEDFAGLEGHTIIMTEKDAVKCVEFSGDNFWYLPVSARLPNVFLDDLCNRLQRSVR
ncbi:MAG: tetraacyldisaccharide 4'-kinase [Alcanivoracaceae bacterium]|nr:tetraacyldisaccharide 4'-kinase [Alcanivoracaceae bacterium]